MKTGLEFIERDACNKHLKPDTRYIEVFPKTYRDVMFIQSIPRGSKTYSNRTVDGGQSPILVELEVWNALQ